MPNGDRTGPEGKGSRTGRGLGYCSGNKSPGRATGFGQARGFGRGAGRGFGRAVGVRRGLGNVQTVSDNVNLSKEDQVKVLENEKREIEAKLKELGK